MKEERKPKEKNRERTKSVKRRKSKRRFFLINSYEENGDFTSRSAAHYKTSENHVRKK